MIPEISIIETEKERCMQRIDSDRENNVSKKEKYV